MKTMAILFLSLIVLTLPLRATTPNDCGLIAAEAYARLDHAGVWAKILFVCFEDGSKHAYVVYCPSRQILAYDGNGTKDLNTQSRELKDIIASLKRWPGIGVIQGGYFID